MNSAELIEIVNEEGLADYLASPYTDPDAAVMQWRYEAVLRKTIELMKAGFNIFSPIVHSHPLALAGVGGDHEYWMRIDRPHLRGCGRTFIHTLPGWNLSEGIRDEIAYSRQIGHEIFTIHPGPGIVLQPMEPSSAVGHPLQ